MNRKDKLDIAISLLKMAREQLELNFADDPRIEIEVKGIEK